MKRVNLLWFGITVACLLGSCQNTYDNIGNFATKELIYPARFDTIFGKIGYERVEIDLLKAGRIPSAQINMGKAKNTVIEYDGNTIKIDSVCSWVSIGGLTQSKIYRFSVFTSDEFGNKSVPQEIALIPFTASDVENLTVTTPRVIASPWAVSLSWTNLSTVLLDYCDLTYNYKDKDGNARTGKCEANPRISMENLQAGEEASIDIRYKIIPKVAGQVILDTLYINRTFSLYMPDEEVYKRDLTNRPVRSTSYTQSQSVQITWMAVDDYTMQYTTVRYMDTSVDPPVERIRRVENTETATVVPGLKIGTPFYISSNYKPEGVEGVFVDSNEKEYFPESIDYMRTGWKTVYTSVQPTNDEFNPGGDASVGYENAHIDGNRSSFLSLAKPGKSTGGSTNTANGTMYFVLDLQTTLCIDYFRILHRTDNTADGLKVWAASIYGANEYLGPVNKFTNPGSSPDNDPTRWEPVREDIAIPRGVSETPDMRLNRRFYRYIKFKYTDWDKNNNSACGVAEFNMGVYRNPVIND